MLLRKKIRPFFLAILFVMALACTANASILEYSNALTLNGSDATVSFRIDTTQGFSNGTLSMHNGLVGNDAYDSLFTISLKIGGTPYYDDAFSWTAAYPSVTLNESDWSINAVDYWVTVGADVFVFETTTGGTTVTTVAFSALDTNNNGVIESSDLDSDGDGNIDSGINFSIDNGPTSPTGDWTTSEVPEPATLSLFGLGLFGWAWVIRRRSLK